MRIGEIAEAAGVTTRTVRHYHQVGVLPEAPRTAGGYRCYGLRDLIQLCHARQLVELGLSLGEVRDVLADGEGDTLIAVIETMDAELAQQQDRIRVQRHRLARLRDRVRGGHLGVEDLPEAELVDFFTRMEELGADGPIMQLDREVLAVVPAAEALRWVRPLMSRMDDDDFARDVAEIYAVFDRLAVVPPDDPLVDECVRHVLNVMPAESLSQLTEFDFDEFASDAVVEAMYAELSPAQVTAARRLLEIAADPTMMNEILPSEENQ